MPFLVATLFAAVSIFPGRPPVPDDIAVPMQALEKGPSKEFDKAVRMLLQVPERAVPALATCLEYQDRKEVCAYVLGRMPPALAAPPLIEAIERTREEGNRERDAWKAYLVATLGTLGGPTAREFLETRYRGREGKTDSVSMSFAWALQHITGEEHAPARNPLWGCTESRGFQTSDSELEHRVDSNLTRIRVLSDKLRGCGTTPEEHILFDNEMWKPEYDDTSRPRIELFQRRNGCPLVDIEQALCSPSASVRLNGLRALRFLHVATNDERTLAAALMLRAIEWEHGNNLSVAIGTVGSVAYSDIPLVQAEIVPALVRHLEAGPEWIAKRAAVGLQSLGREDLLPEEWKERLKPVFCGG